MNFPKKKTFPPCLGKLMFLSVLTVPIIGTFQALAEDPVPASYPVERYEPIWKKSPFTLSSATPEASGTFTDNIALVGIFKNRGEIYAAILDKTTQKRELISSKPNEKGIRVCQVDSSDERSKVSVILEKNGEKATLHYDINFLQANAAKNQPAQPQVPSPNVAPVAGGGQPANRPPRRRIIPSNPNGQAAQASPGAPQPLPKGNSP